jgi:hypothetical protein
MRRLRKLGVSSANEKSDESGNQKTSKADEASNNNNSLDTTSSTSTADKDDNKNVINLGMLGRDFSVASSVIISMTFSIFRNLTFRNPHR